MQDVLRLLEPADYQFLLGVIESPLNLTDDEGLRSLIKTVEDTDTPENRAAVCQLLEREIRYLGSSDTLYAFRWMTGAEPGVSFQEIIRDVAGAVKVEHRSLGTNREQLERLVEAFATKQFADLDPAEQQRMLEELGVEREKAAAFIKRSAGVFALPMMIEAFNMIVVQGLIKTLVFGAIAKVLGAQLAARLFTFLAGRLPWWVGWIGPAVWTLSLGWTALDLQGPAARKTVPIVLYLGLCALRERPT